MSSPGRAPARVSACRRLTVPTTVTSIINGPGDFVRLPPTRCSAWRAATAASSPMPTSSHSGAGASCWRMRATSSRSERQATVRPTVLRNDTYRGTRGARSTAMLRALRVRGRALSSLRIVDGACLTDHRHLDLARVFELVLDAAGDVLRQPHRFFVGDLLAFDHDPDFAAGLQGERLRHALERVGDALELFEPLDVGLEDVAARAGPGGGDRVGRLNDHRLERRPV